MAEDKDKKTEAESGAEGEGEAPKKGKGKLIIIIAIAVLFIGGAGAGGFFFLTSKKKDAPTEEAAEGGHGGGGGGEHGGGEPGGVAETAFFDLPDLTVNLSSSDGSSRFLRLKVALEVASAADAAALEKVKPRIVDDFQIYLRELRPEDLRGSAGTYRLRHDLLLRANQAAQPVRVQNVLFKEFLVQ